MQSLFINFTLKSISLLSVKHSSKLFLATTVAFLCLLAVTVSLFTACNKSISLEDEKLLSSIQKPAKKADSLIIGKQLPLNPDIYDSLKLDKRWVSALSESVVPISSQNTDDHRADEIIPRTYKGKIIELKPQTFTIEPYATHAGLPKPVKAGELRSTGLSNENVFYLNEEQGLPSGRVNDVKEDPRGFLWIASGAGLSRYDGYNLYTYNGRNGLQVNSISEIILHKDSSLWIAAKGGLVHFTGDKFYYYNKECGLPDDEVTDIAFDNQYNLWFVCPAKGLCKLSGNKLTVYGDSSRLPLNGLYKCAVDSANRVVLGAWGGGCMIMETENKLYVPSEYHEYASEAVTNLYADRKGGIWSGSYGIVSTKFGVTHNTRQKFNTGFNYFIGIAHYEDEKANMWIGTGEGGLVRMNQEGYTVYTTKQGLTSNKIMCITGDKKGNIWVGTQDGGLNRITPESFRNYNQNDGLTDKPIASLCMTKRGVLLLGPWADDLFAFNGRNFKRISGVGVRIFLSMAEDKYENLVIGTHQHGVEYFIKSKKDSVMYDSSRHLSGLKDFNNRMAMKIYPAADGSFWLANRASYGLTNYTYTGFQRYFINNGLANNDMFSVAGDSKGNIWLANEGCGISKISNGKITHYTKSSGLPANEVVQVFVDRTDRLWAGTGAGVCYYNGKQFINFDHRDGLSNNNITSIIEDNKGRIWVSTNRGLNVLLPDATSEKRYKVENYLIQDGLKSNSFSLGAVAFDSVKNIMYWGTTSGLLKLDLNNFDVMRQSPPCYLAQVSLMGEFVNFGALKDSMDLLKPLFNKDSSITWNRVQFSGVRPYYNVPENLILPYDINNIAFNFYAFSGNSTHRIKYRYRLKGLSEKWEEVTLPEAKFSNLNAGTYEFEAQARMEGQEWGSECVYVFEVEPPFWLTWWFKLLMAVSLTSIIILIFKVRNRQLLQRQEMLERTVEERTRELSVQKTLIEEKQKEILDSINYARRIQYALLAHADFLKQHLQQHFIFFKPKDIVSGDFYWATLVKTPERERFYLAVCDSTGHGVPGAFMSLLSIGFLNEAIKEKGILEPNKVFDYVRMRLIENISKEGQKDGFDGVLVCFERSIDNLETFDKITFTAANNEPILIRGGQLTALGRDRMPVGMGEREEPFRVFDYKPLKGDLLYLYTDGFADQFGGPRGKKFKYKQLNDLLVQHAGLPLEEQNKVLNTHFESWKGVLEQIDDVCVIGIRL